MALGEAFHRQVVSRLAERLVNDEKHALLILAPDNIRYVTGLAFRPTNRPLGVCVWSDAKIAFFVPQLESEFAASGWVRDVHWYAEFPADNSPLLWMAKEAGGPLLVDAPTAEQFREINEATEEAEISHVVEELRRVKSQAEIDLIERAADYADLALERCFARLTTGSKERDVLADVVAAVDAIMRNELDDDYDSNAQAISGLIRSGTRAAFPNAPSSGRRLTRGDTVVIEFTTNVGGYHARSGATFFVGDPLRDVARWVEGTMLAQESAREAMVPGATCESVDQAARKTLERLGLGNSIRHRTGQGIGLSILEAPWLARGQKLGLQPGMVLVNQPGAYIQGRTGARNSETVLIEEDGARVLNPRLDRWTKLEARLKEF
jgi:Xaa-Pro aminopeptidase